MECALSTNEPDWNTPAHLDGLPCTNWKTRAGVTMYGTMAECVARWLRLPGYQQGACSIGWGPNQHGQHGGWSASNIASYVSRKGLPPAYAAVRKNLSREEITRLIAMEPYRAPPSGLVPAGDAKTPGRKPEAEDSP